MLRWWFLALVAVGCSSSKATNHTSIDGASKQDATDAGAYTGDNSTCPVWPREKLFPIVGPFFYGPDKGPCSFTQTDNPNGTAPKVTVVNFTYGGNRPTLAQTSPDTTLKHQYEYLYLQGQLTTEIDYKEGLSSTIRYTYDTNKVIYSLVDASQNHYEYDYNLDDNGYPKTIDLWLVVNDQKSALSSGPTRFVFEYDKCRISRRDAFTVTGERYDAGVATYSYDDAGHLTEIDSADRNFSYDYSCWAPDAGAN